MKYLKLFEEEFYLIKELQNYIEEDFLDNSDFKHMSWNVSVGQINNKLRVVIEITEPYDDGMDIISIRINKGPLGNYINGIAEDLKRDYEEEFDDVEVDDDQDDDTFLFTIDCTLKEHLARGSKSGLLNNITK